MLIPPGATIKLAPDQKERLRRGVRNLVSESLHQHELYRQQLKVRWDWFECVPKVATRSEPRSSNAIFPLIRTHAKARHARRYLSLFPNQNIWASKTKNEAWRQPSKEFTDFLNTEADDNAFDIRTAANEALLGGETVGQDYLGAQWGRRVKHRLVPGRNGKSKVIPIEIHRGPHLYRIPADQIVRQVDRSLRDSEFVCRLSRMTAAELYRCAVPESQGGAGWDVDEIRQLRPGVMDENFLAKLKLQDFSELHPTLVQPYSIGELWVEWPILSPFSIGETEEETAQRPPIVVHFCTETFRILHVMAHPYPIRSWPFYEFGMKPGFAKEGEHLQRIVSVMLNQGVDVVKIASSFIGVTSDPTVRQQPLPLNGWFYVPSGIQNVNFDAKPQAILQPNVLLIQLCLAAAERLSGMSDPAFGRESRMGGHPSPATSHLSLIQQGQTQLQHVLDFDRIELSRLGEDLLAMYQVLGTDLDGYIEQRVGRSDAAQVRRVLFPEEPLAGAVTLDIRAQNEMLSPQAAFQQAVQLDQVVSNFLARVMQAANVAVQASKGGAPQLAALSVRSIQILSKSYERILQAADVDDWEEFMIQVREAKTVPDFQELRNVAGERLQELSGGGPGPSVPIGGAGIPAAGDQPVTGAGASL